MQRLRQHLRYFVLIIVLVGALLTATHTGARASGASITLSVPSGPPTSYFKVSGTGFGVNEKVIILFDTSQVGIGKTDHAGLFTKSVRVPASATPGTHTIQAIGQSSRLTASTTFLVQTNWPMFGFGPDHSHFNHFENVLNTGNVGNLAMKWQASLANDPLTPVVANGILYVSSGNQVVAIDAATGTTLWTFPLSTYLTPTVPIVAGGTVYVGADRLYAINAASGTLIWESTTFRHLYAPVLGGGLLFFATGSGKYCSFTLSRHPRWCTLLDTISPAAVSGGTVYVADIGGTLYALSEQSGHTLWSYPSSNMFSTGAPSVANGLVYFSTSYTGQDGTLNALNAATGILAWSDTFAGRLPVGQAIANGLLYTSMDNQTTTVFYALDAVSGVVRWSFNGAGEVFPYAPSVADGVVYTSVDGNIGSILYAFDAQTGAVHLIVTPMGSYIVSDAIVVNGRVYIGTGRGQSSLIEYGLPG